MVLLGLPTLGKGIDRQFVRFSLTQSIISCFGETLTGDLLVEHESELCLDESVTAAFLGG